MPLAMSGSAPSGWKSNWIGKLAVAVTETLDVSDGTNQSGDPTTSGRARPLAGLNGARASAVLLFSRGSTKKSAACKPLLVMDTGKVTERRPPDGGWQFGEVPRLLR